MTWHPSKEVAVARDAAEALDDAPICVVLWLTKDGEKLGMASYGKTLKLDELGHVELWSERRSLSENFRNRRGHFGTKLANFGDRWKKDHSR